MSRTYRSRWAITAFAMLLLPLVMSPPAHAKSKLTGVLADLSGRLKREKPLYVLTNVPITGRLASLFAEMDIKGYNEVDLTSDYDPKFIKDAGILILIDRESGNYRPDQEYLVPVTARDAARGTNAVLAAGDHANSRKGTRTTIFISAPTRDALVDFLDSDLRDDSNKVGNYWEPNAPKIISKPLRPPTPGLLFPRGDVKSTRPSVFFVVHNKSDVHLVYDIQVTPVDRDHEYTRDEFDNVGDTFATPDGGWVAFRAEVKPATRYMLDTWGIKATDQYKHHNFQIMTYDPKFDLKADVQYNIRVRSSFADEADQKPGLWSDAEEQIAFTLPPQPSNLGPSTRLTTSESADEMYPSFSSDGNYLLYATNRSHGVWEIYADDANAPGTGSTRLTQSNRLSDDLHPVWGPIDENGVGYCTFERYEKSASTTSSSIWGVAVATKDHPRVPFGYTRYTNFPEDCTSPCWSHDGKRLAFVKANDQGESEIWIIEVGQNPRVLCNGIDPSWDKDCKVLYYSSSANGSWDIWRMDTATGAQSVITTDGEHDEFQPAPNPSGNGDLAYVSNSKGHLSIWVLRAGNPIELTQWLGNDINPTWSPDGKRIIFATTRFSAKYHYNLASIDPYGVSAATDTAN